MISSGKIRQQALSVVLPVVPGKTEALKEFLRAMASSSDSKLMAGLSNSPSTHFARFVIAPDPNRNDRLIFTSNFDGTMDDYLLELFKLAAPALTPLSEYCEGCTKADFTSPAGWRLLLTKNKIREQMFFASLPGLSVGGIKREEKIREILESVLELSPPKHLNGLATLLAINPGAKPAQRSKEIQTPAWLEKLINRLVGIHPGTINANVLASIPPEVSSVEDTGVQNALTVLAPVRSNFLNRLLLRFVLFAGSLATKKAWGSLSGVTTIHFARWIILDGGSNILFESNYDGSWESYIDEFVDASSTGLNAIWGNCPGFPKGGCCDIESFKSVIRSHQLPVLFFFKAYPNLTVKNVLANHSVEQAMNAFINSGDALKVLAGSSEAIV